MQKSILFLLGGCILFIVGYGFGLSSKSISPKPQEEVLSKQVQSTSTPPSQVSDSPKELTPTSPLLQFETATITKVIDGDTVQLNNGKTVRYIGIDTPETKDPRRGVQCFGNEAFEKNKELVEGKVVKLEKDISETDKYGRLLRYVYVGDIFINKTLVEQGFAYASSYPPDIKHQVEFNQAQTLAMNENKGLWGACESSQNSLKSGASVQGNSTVGGDKDCKDFTTQKTAQDFFVSQGGPGSDPHKLDQDKDGVVCESLP